MLLNLAEIRSSNTKPNLDWTPPAGRYRGDIPEYITDEASCVGFNDATEAG